MTPYNILVADDDPEDFQTVMEAFSTLEHAHCVIGHVRNGAELIAHLYSELEVGRGLPDAVILDVNMPKMDGVQALSVIRSEKAFGSLPVIIYSTSGDVTLLQRCKQIGASFCARKGSRFSQVVQFVTAVIDMLANNTTPNESMLDNSTRKAGKSSGL
jgi:CheY-like chemotaxis protein